MKALKNIFGTDGIRGIVGNPPMTADFILHLGWAVGSMLAKQNGNKVLIGKDTRISGYMIESALQAGLSSAGTHIYLVGPMPTPGIAYLTQALRAQIGIVISASHNSHNENGIKFFSSEGYKISHEIEQQIKYWLNKPIKTLDASKLGKAWRIDDAQGRYIEFCKSSIPHHTNLKGLKIVVDCANGAAYNIAPNVFAELGADVIQINSSPDGLNINENSGANHPEIIRRHVIETKSDVGIALDGDGDRVIMVDHKGGILDGDEILYIIAKHFYESKQISGGIIGTYMSNKGLENALKRLGLDFSRVAIGDKNITEGLLKKKWTIGGEPSGHVVNLNVTTTGDGIITALQILHIMQRSGKTLHALRKGLIKFPQCLMNVPHYSTRLNLNNSKIVMLVKDAESTLGTQGRILLRYSGTEPLIRIMVEGEDKTMVFHVAQQLASSIYNLIK